MSSPSRRLDDYSAIRGSGRSPNSVGRSSSQPPQPFQHPTTISDMRGGTANSVSWANRPPSNVQGSAPGQAPAATLYTRHTQPSAGWDDMSLDVTQCGLLIDSAQLQPQQQHITVPELYPSTFPTTTTATSSSRAHFENPQSHDRLQRTAWPGVSRPSPPHISVQPPPPQPPQDVLYSTQPLYRQTQNKDSQNHPSQRQQQQLSSSPPRPRVGDQKLDSNQITPLSQPVVSPKILNTSQVGTPYSSRYNPLPSTPQHPRTQTSDYDMGHVPVTQRPPSNPNRQDVSLRRTRPGEGEGAFYSGGALSSSVPKVAHRPSIPQPVVPNIARQPPPRSPIQASAPVPRARSIPTCLIPGCYEPVVKDIRTKELTEYCGEAHMSEALLRHGVPVCPACKKFPRRSGSEYCGIACGKWAEEQRERQQQRRRQQFEQQQRQDQQQQQQQHSQQRQGGQQNQQQQQHHHQRQGQQSQHQSQQQRHVQPSPYVTWTNVAGDPTNNTLASPDRKEQFNWTSIAGGPGSTSSNPNTSPHDRQGQYNR